MTCCRTGESRTGFSFYYFRHLILALLFLLGLIALRLFLDSSGLGTNLTLMEEAPSWRHPFGTDSLGRDMLIRTVYGLMVSLKVGLMAATISALIALTLGVAGAIFGRWADLAVTWLVDVGMSLPHLVLLILISFAVGGGEKGVMLAVALSHWPSLTRVLRAEALQLKSAPYVVISKKFGRSSWYIATRHFLPHLVPQFLIGLLLLFPHAILHEAALSFLGFGLNPHTPAVGILLAESLQHLSTGCWWLGVLPGLLLVMTVKMFDVIGAGVKKYFTPYKD
ncbi:ABC transporter permease [Deltaproteobacteria bacterium Smac51]|nr:ABC transporter permease [Deltaproteobacteria bacterium Smac51]